MSYVDFRSIPGHIVKIVLAIVILIMLVIIIIRAIKLNEKQIKLNYHLYTPKDNSSGFDLNEDNIEEAPLNKSAPTRILIHEWNEDINSTFNELMRNAYLSRGEFNIISLDWSWLSKTSYTYTRINYSTLSAKAAKFIDLIQEKLHLKNSDLYLIGYGFGAHIAGHIGRSIKSGKPNTIFGLDPRSSEFIVTYKNHLNNKDAEYVEAIYTAVGSFTFKKPIGTATFYVNHGKNQPGCNKDTACWHKKSFEYLAETIKNPNSDRFIVRHCKCAHDILAGSNCTEKNNNINNNNTNINNNNTNNNNNNNNNTNNNNNNNSTNSNTTEVIRMGGEPSNSGKAKGVYLVLINEQNEDRNKTNNGTQTYKNKCKDGDPDCQPKSKKKHENKKKIQYNDKEDDDEEDDDEEDDDEEDDETENDDDKVNDKKTTKKPKNKKKTQGDDDDENDGERTTKKPKNKKKIQDNGSKSEKINGNNSGITSSITTTTDSDTTTTDAITTTGKIKPKKKRNRSKSSNRI